jgi:hypothetical protein
MNASKIVLIGTVTLDSIISWLTLSEANEGRTPKRKAKKGQAQEMGDRQRTSNRGWEGGRLVPLSPLSKSFPKDRGVRRSLPLHASFTPRLVSRPEELGL